MQFDILFLHTPTVFGIPCFWLWLLGSLGAFLLGWLLDWLLSSRRKDVLIENWEQKYNQEHQKNITWEKDYASLKYEHEEAQKQLRLVKNNLQICEADKQILKAKLDGTISSRGASNQVDASSLGTATIGNSGIGAGINVETANAGVDLSYGTIFAEDNLQIVEGVGPKIENLLKTEGITTWSQLGSAKIEDLSAILEKGGSRFKMHDPGSWSKQASLAAGGDWQGLIAFQKSLSSGMLVSGKSDGPAKIEKMGMKILGFSNDPEDLKIVEGIGPKIEQLLKADGINTWSELALASVNKLQDILNKAGERYRLADPSTWPKQADLAAKGLWNDLSEYQDYLQGGKEPGK